MSQDIKNHMEKTLRLILEDKEKYSSEIEELRISIKKNPTNIEILHNEYYSKKEELASLIEIEDKINNFLFILRRRK